MAPKKFILLSGKLFSRGAAAFWVWLGEQRHYELSSI